MSERTADVRAHEHLVDALHLVFDGVLGRHDADVDLVDLVEEGVEAGGFARAGGAGDEDDAVGAGDELVGEGVVALAHAQVLELDEVAGFLEQAQGDALAVGGGAGGDADVDVLAVEADADATVHRQALLGDVEVGHDLEAGDDGGLEAVDLRRHVDLVQHPVDPVADAQLVLHRLHVDVGGALAVGLGDDLVHEADDRGLLPHLVHVDLRDVRLGVGDLVAAVLDHLLDGLGAHAVIFLDGLVDLLGGCQADAHGLPARQADAVGRGRVHRVGDGHRQHVPLHRQRQRVVLVDRARRQQAQRLVRRARLGQVHVFQAEHRGQTLQELALLGHLQPGHGLGDALPEVGVEQDLDLGVGEQPRPLEQVRQKGLLRGHAVSITYPDEKENGGRRAPRANA